jgi:malate dehydrogenase
MKISVVGAGGNVGAAAALTIAQRDFAQEVVAIDLEIKREDRTFNPAKGRALDQWQTSPIHLFDTRVHGTTDYAATRDSDICIITAGVPRRPGMSRDDLLSTNAEIVRPVAEKLAHYSPGTILIVVSNPLDAMTYVAYRASGLPAERVMGHGRPPGYGPLPRLPGRRTRGLAKGHPGRRSWVATVTQWCPCPGTRPWPASRSRN